MKKSPPRLSKLLDPAVTDECHAADAGLLIDEYERLHRLLGRAPNKVELGITGALWSEHCSYKSSKAHLSKLPTKGEHVVVGPGENAGVVDIGDNLALVFKIESHNHPSFIEPFQGAATGVGGILRDIFTMGAKPFAALNFLRFGDEHQHNFARLFHGVVGGIAHYGNCFGIPTVLTNLDYHKSYNGNNLVNAFAIGVVKKDAIFLGKAQGEKNRVLYVGAKTGRDGIMGAVMASDVFTDETEEKRPTVQVGDPFVEKLLLDACMTIFQEKLVVGIQDMGAAGLSCSLFEMAHRASTGLTINLNHVPVRDRTMSAYDIMLSESQERMLLVARPGDVPRIKEVFAKYELACADIGQVSGDGVVRISYQGQEVVHLSSTLLVENAPRYRRNYLPMPEGARHAWKKVFCLDVQGGMESFKTDLGQKEASFITSQFDHHIGLNTVVGPNEAEAALVMVPGVNKAVALSCVGNGKRCSINPQEGARRTVFQAYLEVSAQGAHPLGITNCLNFGSPENPVVMTDFKYVVEGMAQAASSLNLPVVSGNVSFYNETNDEPILPTLALVLVGITEKPSQFTKHAHAQKNDRLLLLGDVADDFAGHEHVLGDHNQAVDVKPWEESEIIALGDVLRKCVRDGLVSCASVIGRGGILRSLIKIMSRSSLGIKIEFGAEWMQNELALGLLSEDAPLVLISISDDNFSYLADLCMGKISIHHLGYMEAGADTFSISHQRTLIFSEPKDVIVDNYRRGLGDFLASLQ